MRRFPVMIAMLLSASFASAYVATSNTLCWIEVPSTSANTIISTSLVDVGLPAASTIDVSSFVVTRNLKKGDTLRRKVAVSSGGSTLYGWESWVLDEDGDKGGGWVPTMTTFKDDAGNDVTVSAPDETAFSPAGAFVLWRANPEDGPICIRGQIENSAGARTQVAAEKVSFLANRGIADVGIEDIPWDDGKAPANGDKMQLTSDDTSAGVVSYVWNAKSNAWCTNRVETVTAGGLTYTKTTAVPIAPGSVKVPAGQGFVLTRKSTTGTAPSVTWPDIRQ